MSQSVQARGSVSIVVGGIAVSRAELSWRRSEFFAAAAVTGHWPDSRTEDNAQHGALLGKPVAVHTRICHIIMATGS